MKKMMYLVVFLFFGLTACVNKGDFYSFDWGKSEFFEVEISETEKVYFEYPSAAEITFDNGAKGKIRYQDCILNFGKKDILPEINEPEYEISEKGLDGMLLKAGHKSGVFVFYAALLSDFVFWTQNEYGVSDCVDFVERVAISFSDRPVYRNDTYSYRVEIPAEFKLEYLSGGEGILLKKWIEPVEKEGNFEVDDEEDEEPEMNKIFEGGYKVEITVFAYENLTEWKELPEYIGNKYIGYSLEFQGDKVFINEGSGDSAIRRFLKLGENGNIVYEASLKVPSFYFNTHKQYFDNFVDTIEFF